MKKSLSPEMLRATVLDLGGYLDPLGYVNMCVEDPEAYICIAVDESILGTIIEEHPDWIEEFVAKLGGEPQTGIAIDIDSRSGSYKLAIDFTFMCMEIWPCALYTLTTPLHLLTKEDILGLKNDAFQYAQLKIGLAQQYSRVEDRGAYTEAKSPFIWTVIAQADEWAQQIGWIPGLSDV